MASLDLKPQQHLPCHRSHGCSAWRGRARGPGLAFRREGGRADILPSSSVGPWGACGLVLRGVTPSRPSTPGPVSSQILTTVLTGHAPNSLLGSSLPPFLAGGFALGWARRCLLGALPSLYWERVLSGVCRRAGLGPGCRPPAGVPSWRGGRSECQEPDRGVCCSASLGTRELLALKTFKRNRVPSSPR